MASTAKSGRAIAHPAHPVPPALCRLQALARKVVRSCNWLPMIAELTGQFDIVIRGVGLKADQLRAVYRGALDRCKTLLQELLLGITVNISKPFHLTASVAG